VGKALTIRVCREADYVLVRLAGEVDIATVAGLRGHLRALAAGGISLVVDLDQVTFIDAAGLGALADTAVRAAFSVLKQKFEKGGDQWIAKRDVEETT
jgi:anti-anti-sigma factor